MPNLSSFFNNTAFAVVVSNTDTVQVGDLVTIGQNGSAYWAADPTVNTDYVSTGYRPFSYNFSTTTFPRTIKATATQFPASAIYVNNQASWGVDIAGVASTQLNNGNYVVVAAVTSNNTANTSMIYEPVSNGMYFTILNSQGTVLSGPTLVASSDSSSYFSQQPRLVAVAPVKTGTFAGGFGIFWGAQGANGGTNIAATTYYANGVASSDIVTSTFASGWTYGTRAIRALPAANGMVVVAIGTNPAGVFNANIVTVWPMSGNAAIGTIHGSVFGANVSIGAVNSEQFQIINYANSAYYLMFCGGNNTSAPTYSVGSHWEIFTANNTTITHVANANFLSTATSYNQSTQLVADASNNVIGFLGGGSTTQVSSYLVFWASGNITAPSLFGVTATKTALGGGYLIINGGNSKLVLS